MYINPTATLQTFNDATDLSIATVEITTLDLRSATHLTTIGYGAFANNSISEIKLNNAITTIDGSAFFNNHLTGALTIPSSVQIIGQSAFGVDSGSEYKLTGLNLSNAINLTSIGSYAFAYQNISSLDLSGATHLTTIGEGAFDNNHISGTLTIPSSLQTIGVHAFYANGITSLNFANATSLTTIGDSAFRFNALSSLDLSGATSLTTIEENAFYQNRIQTLTLPSSIESIVEDAFCMQNYDVNNPNTSLDDQLQTINVPLSKSVFESKVGSSNNWYYDGGSRPNFQLIFTDYTCDYEGVCELN